MSEPLILVRALHFAATVLASGTVVFMMLVAEPPPGLRRRLVRLIWAALAAAVLTGAVWVVLLASDIFGASIAEVCRSGDAVSVLADTRFGQVASLRLALAVVLAALLAIPGTRSLQLVAAALFAVLPAWAGHAGAGLGTAGLVTLAADVVHLLAAAAWLGALPALALFLRAERRSVEMAGVTGRFSRLGIACVAALLASGLVNAWTLLGSPQNLIATDYGRILLLKVGLFLAMVAIAAVNRLYLTPRLPEPGPVRALVRNSLAETGLGAGVLLFVGVLGTLPPATHVHTPAAVPPEAAYVHIHTAETMADVILVPGRAAQANATIRLSREDGTEFPAQVVRIALDPPQGAGKSLQADATRRPDGTWEVPNLTLGVPGVWTVRVIVGTGPGRETVLDAPVLIEP